MAHYSVIHIGHNSLHDIEENPEDFVKDLMRAIRRFPGSSYLGRDVRAGGSANCARVITQDHYDGYHMLVTGGGTGWDLGICALGDTRGLTEKERTLKWLEAIAKEHGYKLTPEKKKR